MLYGSDGHESQVKSYCRSFPKRFRSALGARITDTQGVEYIDFLAGCGALNYGHNEPRIKARLLEYIEANGIAMSMDMYTESKEEYIRAFHAKVLAPRNLSYRLQFSGPTGTNAVEAAVKLARKVTGRSNVVAFTNGFHGCTLAALSLTGNKRQRASSSALLSNVTRFPYEGYLGSVDESLEYCEKLLTDPSSGIDPPAAFVLEVIQGEGGLNVASARWARGVAQLAHSHGATLIVDEIQTGCGRSGRFFAFEELGLTPDMVVMAKAVSGFGLPLSLVLIRPELDQWSPGEHNGTFRGNNYAFVTARSALDLFWSDTNFETGIAERATHLGRWIDQVCERFGVDPKGRGCMRGIDLGTAKLCQSVREHCFAERLIIEDCGPNDEVLKFLPPLNIPMEDLEHGLQVVLHAIEKSVRSRTH